MLSYFPEIRTNESTYSILSRMQFALQPSNVQHMGIILFNNKNCVGKLNFQGPFDYLCSNLPPKFTPEYFFNNHTVYPLYSPFLSIESQENALVYFKNGNNHKIYVLLNHKILSGKRQFIRVCKHCVNEDFIKYGDTFYRRQHEIELNRVCFKHKIPLYEYILPPHNNGIRKYTDYFTILNNLAPLNIPDKFKKIFLNISEDVNSLFTLDLKNFNLYNTKDKICQRIIEKGYLSSVLKKLSQDFKEYYTEDFLNYINLNFNINPHNCWFRNVTTSHKYFNGDPIKFILLIRWLFGSFENFYRYENKYST